MPQDFPSIIEYAKVLGFPGLLFILLYLFIRDNSKKWESTRLDDKEKWGSMVKQHQEAFDSALKAHKEERERDFAHLRDQMEFLHGQHHALTIISARLEGMQVTLADVKRGVDFIPQQFRDVHSRLDNVLLDNPKGQA